MKNHLSIDRSKTEGCKHDPYCVEEISWTNVNGETIMVHYGLEEFIVLPNGQRIDQCVLPVVDEMTFDTSKRYLCSLWDIFVGFVGVDGKVIERMIEHYYDDWNEDPFGGPGVYI